MPRGDRTGPDGLGAMTGRKAGYCAGYSVPGFMNPVPRRGLGFRGGFGQRRGFAFSRQAGFAFNPVPNFSPYQNVQVETGQELEYLQNTAKTIGEELAVIQERIAKIKEEQE